MKNQKRPNFIKNKMIIPLEFHQIDFDWAIMLKNLLTKSVCSLNNAESF